MSRHRDIRNRSYSYDEDYGEEDAIAGADAAEGKLPEQEEQFVVNSAERPQFDLMSFAVSGSKKGQRKRKGQQVAAAAPPPTAPPADDEVLAPLVPRVREVVGTQLGIAAIQHALRRYNYDVDLATAELLERPRPASAAGKPAATPPPRSPAAVPWQRMLSDGSAASTHSSLREAATAPNSRSTSPAPAATGRASGAASASPGPAAEGRRRPQTARPEAAARPSPSSRGKPMRNARQQREADRLLAEAEESDRDPATRGRLNLVVVGHVDAGKSTLMGHLLVKLGRVTQRTLHRFRREAEEKGKASFAYAWVMDEHADERERGVTIDVGVNAFETERREVLLLDAPGHRDFIPNMITGAAQADAALLVVPASPGDFEAGFGDGGQTKEHAILARSLGVSQIVVVVNKLDTVSWSEARFEEIKGLMEPFLLKWGFKPGRTAYVPASGLSGDNLVDPDVPALRAWYSGPTLSQAIDALQPSARPTRKPLRAMVTDVFRTMSLGTTVGCKVESGFLVAGDRVLSMPLGATAVVRGVERQGEPMRIAKAGDNVEVGLTGIEPNGLGVGQVLCPPDDPVPAAVKVEARIQTLPGLAVALIRGSAFMFHHHAVNEPCVVTSLVELLDVQTGEVVKRKPRRIPRHASAVVQIRLARPVCLETFADYKRLGRFMLRDKGVTAAAGIVTGVVRKAAIAGT